MPSLNHPPHMCGCCHHSVWGVDREIKLLYAIILDKEAAHGIRNYDGVICEFRLFEGVHSLFKGTDYYKRQSAQFDHLPESRIYRAIRIICQLFSDYTNLTSRLQICCIEKSPGQNDQVANPFIIRINSEDLQITFLPSTKWHSLLQGQHRGCCHNLGDFLPHDFQVVDRKRVRGGIGDPLCPPLVFGKNPINSNPVNLPKHIFFTCHPDCDDED